MRRVGDELALRPRGRLERREHRVERGRQAGELVTTALLDALREVARLRHLFGRPGESSHRCEDGARDEQPEGGGDAHPHDGDHEEPVADPGECAVDLVERARDLERVALLEREGEHAHMCALDVRVGEERLADRTRRRRAVAIGDRQRNGLADRPDRPPVARHELEVPARPAEERRWQVEEAAAAARVLDDPEPRGGGAGAQRLVDLAAQLAPDDDVGDGRRGGDRHGDRRRAGQGDTGAEAHRSRSA